MHGVLSDLPLYHNIKNYLTTRSTIFLSVASRGGEVSGGSGSCAAAPYFRGAGRSGVCCGLVGSFCPYCLMHCLT